jgi:drug/metabolite transporter (DMT)-like permease
MIFTLLVALIAIMLLVGGQTLLKVGLNEIGGVSLFDGNPVGSLLGLLRTPWIILGFFCYGVSAILWLDVLSKLDFSLAFPMVSLTYVFSLVIGRFIFHETVGLDRIAGVLLILSGLFFVVRSGS